MLARVSTRLMTTSRLVRRWPYYRRESWSWALQPTMQVVSYKKV
jgi:hypothetical protein